MMSLQARRSSHHVFSSVVGFVTSPGVFIFILMLNLCWGFSSQRSVSRRSGMAGVPSAAGLDVISPTFPWGQRWLEAARNLQVMARSTSEHNRFDKCWNTVWVMASVSVSLCSLHLAFGAASPVSGWFDWLLGGFDLTRNLSGCSVVVSLL